MRNRFVKINRILRADGGTDYFHMPVELRNGNLYALAQPADHPQGFCKPSAAWAVIDRIEAHEAEINRAVKHG